MYYIALDVFLLRSRHRADRNEYLQDGNGRALSRTRVPLLLWR